MERSVRLDHVHGKSTFTIVIEPEHARFLSSALKSPGKPVDFFNAELERIAQNMIETMYAASGAGLAANQVGIDISITTIDISGGRDSTKLITLCNPEIIASEGEQREEEGCLSIPEFSEVVTRPRKIIIRGQDIHGNEIRIEAERIRLQGA